MSVLDGPGEGTWSVFVLKVVEERDELRHKLAGEAAHIKSLEGLLVDAVRERDDARDRADFLMRECDRVKDENRRLSDDFESVWNSRDEVIKERDRARQACNAYWHDLMRIGSICEQTADEYPLKAVERTVREFRAVIAERDAMKDRIASMQESMSMACEEPPTNCECAGCSYAREKGGDA